MTTRGADGLAPALVGLMLAGAVIGGIRTSPWWGEFLGSYASDTSPSSPPVLPTGTLNPCLGGSTCVSPGELVPPMPRLVALIAGERTRAGCASLQLDTRLLQAAQARASAFADGDKISHTDSEQRTPQDRAEAFGYHGRVHEVLAVGIASPDDVMSAWLNQRIDTSTRTRLDDCSAVTLGVGYQSHTPNDTYGDGAWVVLLGKQESG